MAMICACCDPSVLRKCAADLNILFSPDLLACYSREHKHAMQLSFLIFGSENLPSALRKVRPMNTIFAHLFR